MDQIIAGRFQTKDEADNAAAQLSNYIGPQDISIFHNNPPGQHGTYPIGGDEHADPAARDAENPAAIAAAGLTAGAVGTVVGGPLVGLAAAGVAAYGGSLVSTMKGLKDDPEPDRRQGGVFLAVRIAGEDIEARVINELKQQGAADIEKTKGEWQDGAWVDFNPVARPRLIEGQDSTRP